VTPRIQKINQIAVQAKDVERATEFYRDVLGLPHLFSAPPGLSFFSVGEVRLMISAVPGEEPSGNSILYFAVPDIQAAAQAVRDRAELVDGPHVVATLGHTEIWICLFKDSEGNTMAFMEERMIP
jgi:methylmalonyl-CoA/ethylmalonyl-CoA epimerase